MNATDQVFLDELADEGLRSAEDADGSDPYDCGPAGTGRSHPG